MQRAQALRDHPRRRAGVGRRLGTPEPVVLDGWMILALSGVASAVVLLVAGVSFPVLLRATPPDGLRTD